MRDILNTIAVPIILPIVLAVALVGGMYWYLKPTPIPPQPSDFEIREFWVSNIWATPELTAFAEKEDIDGIKSYADMEKRLTTAGLGKAWYAVGGLEHRRNAPSTDFNDAYLILEGPEKFERSKAALLALARKERTIPAIDYRFVMVNTMPPELASVPPHEGLRRIVAEQNQIKAEYAKD